MNWFVDFYLNSSNVYRHTSGSEAGKNLTFPKHNWERVEGNRLYGHCYKCKDCGVNLVLARGRMIVTGKKIYSKHAKIGSIAKCKDIKKNIDGRIPKPPQPTHRWVPFKAARNGNNSQLCKKCGQVTHLLNPLYSGTEFPKYRWSLHYNKYVKPKKCEEAG